MYVLHVCIIQKIKKVKNDNDKKNNKNVNCNHVNKCSKKRQYVLYISFTFKIIIILLYNNNMP